MRVPRNADDMVRFEAQELVPSRLPRPADHRSASRSLPQQHDATSPERVPIERVVHLPGTDQRRPLVSKTIEQSLGGFHASQRTSSPVLCEVNRSDGWHDMATAHLNVGTGDLAGQVRRQESQDLGDLLVFTAASEGHHRLIPSLALRAFTPNAFGDRPAGCHLVNRDLRGANFPR
jgi:hypothetical protein